MCCLDLSACRRAVRPLRHGDETARSGTDGGTACPAAICRPVGAPVAMADGGTVCPGAICRPVCMNCRLTFTACRWREPVQGVPVVVAWRCSDGWARRAVRPSRRGDESAQSVTDGGTVCPAAICRPIGAHGAACRRAGGAGQGGSGDVCVPVVVAWRCSDGRARRAGVRPSRRGGEPAQSMTDGGTACPAAICRPVGAHGAACRRAGGAGQGGSGDVCLPVTEGRGLSACAAVRPSRRNGGAGRGGGGGVVAPLI